MGCLFSALKYPTKQESGFLLPSVGEGAAKRRMRGGFPSTTSPLPLVTALARNAVGERPSEGNPFRRLRRQPRGGLLFIGFYFTKDMGPRVKRIPGSPPGILFVQPERNGYSFTGAGVGADLATGAVRATVVFGAFAALIRSRASVFPLPNPRVKEIRWAG
jgi:hypothetical protein